ncbi:RNA methyltransferase [Sporanaerobium hydrogeniformans]|uniref:RNA methyltransferase n=1 Tax=Sporanaerobium hydrogeniformans TaxID=3072179 RepID=A0AC61DEF1_9FIRM|nr:RsmB/NOP family class I SAM-dependent RNA methyltransferase [Sporanaerobium hydrogeniformans]PHV71536.1 RNA methyltransferase [Sporanaerobium hydrogeniformans]
MKLPVAFETKMRKLLGEEYAHYIASYNHPKSRGFRINPLKVSMEEWNRISPFETRKRVPWCEQGFYYEAKEKPTKHPYYFAGLYYIQEPSAMAPGAYLPIEEGDRVLDLCAAPGGKSTQVGSRLGQKGVLVSNDISATRAMALLKNIESFGIRNAIVTAETPERLSSKLEGYFDKILIDAPCSGEGMFKKSEEAIKSWEKYGVSHCCNLQREILDYAAHMLRPQGMILYSTCTFSPEENEGMMEAFLTKHPDFKVIPLTPKGGIQKAHPEWGGAREALKDALRLWPHHLEGEGHFVCLLQKKGEKKEYRSYLPLEKRIKDYPDMATFFEKETTISLETPVMEVKGKIYAVPKESPDLSGLRVLRNGLLLGELKNKRFEPSHALVLGYEKDCFKHTIDFKAEDEAVKRYLKGETLLYEAPKGYHVITVDGYPLGWVKAQNDRLKNEYPPSWRMMG